MKVALIIGKLNVGGSTHQVLHLANQVAQHSHTAVVLHGCNNTHEEVMNELALELGVALIEIPTMQNEFKFTPIADWLALIAICRVLRELGPDIVHTHSTKAGLLGRIAAKICRTPVIIHTFHGHLFLNYFGKVKSALLRISERCLRQITNQYTTVSGRLVDELLELGVVKRDRVVVIPCGIDLQRVSIGLNSEASLHERLGVSRDHTLVGTIGRQVPIKGHGDLIAAASIVINKIQDVSFILIGDGPLSTQLRANVKNRSLEDRIFFLNSITDASHIYKDLDFFVLPSWSEGLSLTLIEAMASGVPVIATDVGGTSDIVTEGETGILFEPRNPNDCAEKMTWALTNKGKMQQMAKKARSNIYPTYGIEDTASETIRLYQKLVQNKT